MNKAEAVELVTSVVADIQKLSGRDASIESPDVHPIGDLDQFDSLNGVEATTELSGRLSVDLPGVNIFVSDDGTQALTITEVAQRLCSLAESSEKAK